MCTKNLRSFAMALAGRPVNRSWPWFTMLAMASVSPMLTMVGPLWPLVWANRRSRTLRSLSLHSVRVWSAHSASAGNSPMCYWRGRSQWYTCVTSQSIRSRAEAIGQAVGGWDCASCTISLFAQSILISFDGLSICSACDGVHVPVLTCRRPVSSGTDNAEVRTLFAFLIVAWRSRTSGADDGPRVRGTRTLPA